ncbi:DoxX family protein [Mucilaginibacter lappiensis]|uniref:Membrane protein YphA (DoxX/SURF4 family) n=1 Tax=Mucilaginibacter lappiensis TaxID=354630 RepID=A0A1N6SPZ8_9SPHI|nr:DoxX family protein [Mucilaginibacter lappiensis]MBB6108305.1 putative membrane protein YphA (DoxX/SURF4 family) [Mucilaginibacter lappiensis]MBB6129931.1 putative membrane protein YphA (DoxX/SURF4 family) [Mucilaginibacter lappiensis]SIQ43102.1 DoxX-like family protein [Mucilaginibacter lappiensis]
MKKINIIYWVFTGLLLAFMGIGAVPDLLSMPEALAIFKQLGYPAYLSPFMGAVKLLGVIAILIPGFPRIKEWVYAGFVFDLTGATFSSLAIGTPVLKVSPMLIGYALIIGSYIYHHKRLKAKQV